MKCIELALFVYFTVHPLIFIGATVHGILLGMRCKLTRIEWMLSTVFAAFLAMLVLVAALSIFGNKVSVYQAWLFTSAGPLPIGALLLFIVSKLFSRYIRWFNLVRVGWSLSMGVILVLGSWIGEALTEFLGVTITY